MAHSHTPHLPVSFPKVKDLKRPSENLEYDLNEPKFFSQEFPLISQKKSEVVNKLSILKAYNSERGTVCLPGRCPPAQKSSSPSLLVTATDQEHLRSLGSLPFLPPPPSVEATAPAGMQKGRADSEWLHLNSREEGGT